MAIQEESWDQTWIQSKVIRKNTINIFNLVLCKLWQLVTKVIMFGRSESNYSYAVLHILLLFRICFYFSTISIYFHSKVQVACCISIVFGVFPSFSCGKRLCFLSLDLLYQGFYLWNRSLVGFQTTWLVDWFISCFFFFKWGEIEDCMLKELTFLIRFRKGPEMLPRWMVVLFSGA